MPELVKRRLQSLGYIPTAADEWAIRLIARKVERDILDNCNLMELPEGLRPTAVDMACGEFLLAKKAAPEGLAGFDLDAVEKQVKEGDTTVTLNIGEGAKTPEQRLDALIAHLMAGRNNLAAYRRLKW